MPPPENLVPRPTVCGRAVGAAAAGDGRRPGAPAPRSPRPQTVEVVVRGRWWLRTRGQRCALCRPAPRGRPAGSTGTSDTRAEPECPDSRVSAGGAGGGGGRRGVGAGLSVHVWRGWRELRRGAVRARLRSAAADLPGRQVEVIVVVEDQAGHGWQPERKPRRETLARWWWLVARVGGARVRRGRGEGGQQRRVLIGGGGRQLPATGPLCSAVRARGPVPAPHPLRSPLEDVEGLTHQQHQLAAAPPPLGLSHRNPLIGV